MTSASPGPTATITFTPDVISQRQYGNDQALASIEVTARALRRNWSDIGGPVVVAGADPVMAKTALAAQLTILTTVISSAQTTLNQFLDDWARGVHP